MGRLDTLWVKLSAIVGVFVVAAVAAAALAHGGDSWWPWQAGPRATPGPMMGPMMGHMGWVPYGVPQAQQGNTSVDSYWEEMWEEMLEHMGGYGWGCPMMWGWGQWPAWSGYEEYTVTGTIAYSKYGLLVVNNGTAVLAYRLAPVYIDSDTGVLLHGAWLAKSLIGKQATLTVLGGFVDSISVDGKEYVTPWHINVEG